MESIYIIVSMLIVIISVIILIALGLKESYTRLKRWLNDDSSFYTSTFDGDFFAQLFCGGLALAIVWPLLLLYLLGYGILWCIRALIRRNKRRKTK